MPTLINLLASQLKIGRTFTDFLSIEQIDFCCNRYTSSTLSYYKHLKVNCKQALALIVRQNLHYRLCHIFITSGYS